MRGDKRRQDKTRPDKTRQDKTMTMTRQDKTKTRQRRRRRRRRRQDLLMALFLTRRRSQRAMRQCQPNTNMTRRYTARQLPVQTRQGQVDKYPKIPVKTITKTLRTVNWTENTLLTMSSMDPMPKSSPERAAPMACVTERSRMSSQSEL
jgi:hypothetical protein